MRISDWSSDVCSSDLEVAHLAVLAAPVDRRLDRPPLARRDGTEPLGGEVDQNLVLDIAGRGDDHRAGIVVVPVKARPRLARHAPDDPGRSEEHRVGKEGVGTRKSRLWPMHLQKKKKQ